MFLLLFFLLRLVLLLLLLSWETLNQNTETNTRLENKYKPIGVTGCLLSRRPVFVPVTGVRYNSLLGMCTLKTLT